MGAYAARWVAKSLVKAGLCRRCLVQVSYAIGVAEPLSITVMDYGTSNKTASDLTPGKIVKDLELKKPIFQNTSSYGHFGRPEFSWENPSPRAGREMSDVGGSSRTPDRVQVSTN